MGDNGNLTKVLIIDDDQAMCETLRLVLEPQMFKVYEAHSGQQGIEDARSLKPDVVIVDLLLPAMDACQVTKTIRTFSRVPILMLSAVSTPDIVTKALDEGADEYIVKPMPSSVLIAHLNRLTRRARAELTSQNAFVE